MDDSATLTPEMMTHQKSWGPENVPKRKKKIERKFGIIIRNRVWPEMERSTEDCLSEREKQMRGQRIKETEVQWRYEFSPSQAAGLKPQQLRPCTPHCISGSPSQPPFCHLQSPACSLGKSDGFEQSIHIVARLQRFNQLNWFKLLTNLTSDNNRQQSV